MRVKALVHVGDVEFRSMVRLRRELELEKRRGCATVGSSVGGSCVGAGWRGRREVTRVIGK